MGHSTIRGNSGSYSPLSNEDVTVGEVLKRANYNTGCIGKWNMGDYGTTGYPLNHGFDYFIG